MFIQLFKKKKWPTYAGIFLLWTFSTFSVSNSLVKLVEYPWERISSEDAMKADGIVVLSGGGIKEIAGKKKIVEWLDPDRFFNGVDLYNKKKAKRLFFTGGYSPLYLKEKSEGQLYLDEAQKRGLDLKFISVTRPVKNTLEEARELSKLFLKRNDLKSKRIILVTSAFHMHRAKKIFEREGFIVSPFPVDFKSRKSNLIQTFTNPYNWLPTAGGLSKSSISIREFIGRLFYQVWK